MSFPPTILDLRVAEAGKCPHHIWLPIFLLWPLAIVLLALALVGTILADVVLITLGARYHAYTRFLLGCLQLMNETRGTTAYIRNEQTNVDLTIL